MLEIQGELPFKIGAYRRAAESIAHSPIDIARAYRLGTPPRLPGVGKAIDEKLDRAGRHGPVALLRAAAPRRAAVRRDAAPGARPRPADGWRAVAPGRHLLARRARGGRARGAPAGPEGHEREDRGATARRAQDAPRAAAAADAPGHRPQDIVERVTRSLTDAPGVKSVVPAGSFRRRRETVADIDVLVETDDPAAVIERLHGMPWVERVGGFGPRTGGATRTTVQLMRGPQVDLMTMPVGAAGTYLVHFTGSAAHNVRLREMARDRGWSLSEHGFTSLADETRTSGHLRHRGGGLRLPGPAVHRARAARGPRRDRGRPGRPAAQPRHARRPSGRLPHPFRLVGRPLPDRAHGRRGAQRAACATRC